MVLLVLRVGACSTSRTGVCNAETEDLMKNRSSVGLVKAYCALFFLKFVVVPTSGNCIVRVEFDNLRENDKMKIKIILTIALCLVAIEGITFSGTSSWAKDKFFASIYESDQVELYVTSWCPYCRQAIDFFRSRGISYVVYDIEQDGSAARRKNELDPRRGVPFAVINGIKIHGFSEKAYLKALNHD